MVVFSAEQQAPGDLKERGDERKGVSPADFPSSEARLLPRPQSYRSETFLRRKNTLGTK